LLIVVLKVLPQHSHRPIVNSVLFPALSGFPAIFQVFSVELLFHTLDISPYFGLVPIETAQSGTGKTQT